MLTLFEFMNPLLISTFEEYLCLVRSLMDRKGQVIVEPSINPHRTISIILFDFFTFDWLKKVIWKRRYNHSHFLCQPLDLISLCDVEDVIQLLNISVSRKILWDVINKVDER